MTATGKRAFRDVTICGAGFVYVALVLCINLDSPLFGVLWLVVASHELLTSHRHPRAKPSP
jgi:hypothetical protein